MIQTYFAHIKQEFDRYTSANFVLNAAINFETRSGDQAFINGYVVFIDGSRFFFREYLDELAGNVDKLMYVYHYQTSNDSLLFRYDNAQHKPKLPFLEHKHTPSNQIQRANSPAIHDVLIEIAMQQGWV